MTEVRDFIPDEDIPTSISTDTTEKRQCSLCEMMPTKVKPSHTHCLYLNADFHIHAHVCKTRNVSCDAMKNTLRKHKRIRIHSPTEQRVPPK